MTINNDRIVESYNKALVTYRYIIPPQTKHPLKFTMIYKNSFKQAPIITQINSLEILQKSNTIYLYNL